MTDYLPREGTSVARIVAFLHSLPEDAEVGTSEICDALGLDGSIVITCAGAAINAGLIIREKRDTRYIWRRGSKSLPADYFAAAAPAEPAPAGSMINRLTAPRIVPGDDGPADVRILRGVEAAQALGLGTPPVMAPVPSPPPPPPPPAASKRPQHAVRAGIWSDGSLTIEKGGRIETYTPEEAKQLLRFFTYTLLRQGEPA